MTRQPGIRDNTDRQLLALLQGNARQSTMTLAKRLGMARSTVHERICRLERDGVIRGYSVRLGRDPFDQYVRATAWVSLDQRRQRQVLDRLKLLPEVKLCGTVAGEFDLVLLLEAPCLADLDAVLDEVVHTPGIERCRSAVVMNMVFDRLGASA